MSLFCKKNNKQKHTHLPTANTIQPKQLKSNEVSLDEKNRFFKMFLDFKKNIRNKSEFFSLYILYIYQLVLNSKLNNQLINLSSNYLIDKLLNF